MMSVSRRVAAAAAVLALPFASLAGAQAATVDTTPPALVSYSVTPVGSSDLAFNLDREDAAIKVRMHITDATGLDRYQDAETLPEPIVFVGSKDGTDMLMVDTPAKLVSGTTKDGWYETTIALEYGMSEGSWDVVLTPLMDELGNMNDETVEANYTTLGTFSVAYDSVSDSPFIDVQPGMLHYDAMVWMGNTGISTGWATGTGAEYRPLLPVNRDAMAAFLYRQAGSPRVSLPARSPFKDVKPGQLHYTAIIWASQQGITKGWPDGTFRPTQPINRDAMAAFLYRFAGQPAYKAPVTSPFKDVKTSQLFYKEMSWMKTSGISTGWSDGTYRPLTSVKRDAMAAFLYRYDQKF